MKNWLILLFLVTSNTMVSVHAQRTTAPTTAELAAERAQMQEQFESLRGAYNDLIAVVELQRKEIAGLKGQIEGLKAASTTRASNNSANFATKEELAALQKSISELNEKWNRQRKQDQDDLVKQLTDLKNLLAKSPAPTPSPSPTPAKGYDHTIASGDTYSGIVKAYNDAYGLGITIKDLEKANPGVDPTKLMVGKKIFVPDPR